MRALPLFAAISIGLALCGRASAQGTTDLYKNNYAYSGNSTALYQQNYAQGASPANRIGPANNTSLTRRFGGFSPKSVFTRFQSPQARPTFEPLPTPPNPQTDRAGYLKAIGMRPLR